MVVTSVHIVSSSESLSGPQMIDTYSTQLESLGAKKSGNFSVECDNYISNTAITALSTPKVLNLILASEYPASAFALLENGPTIVADSSFDQILTNLSNFYTPRKLARMEVRGQRWSLSDFVVKLGQCTMGPNFKAVVCEIEYGPSSIPNNCWDLIKELAQTFIGTAINTPHPHLVSRMNEIYAPVDTIHQYNDIFNQLRKSTVLAKT